jgi:hypothetical protein
MLTNKLLMNSKLAKESVIRFATALSIAEGCCCMCMCYPFAERSECMP